MFLNQTFNTQWIRLEAEQAAREAELAAQRQAEEEQERKEELERKKRREEYKRKEKEKREKEVREKRQREIERENKKREKELAAEKRQNEERMKREQVITNQATKPQEQKKTKAPIKVNFGESKPQIHIGLINYFLCSIETGKGISRIGKWTGTANQREIMRQGTQSIVGQRAQPRAGHWGYHYGALKSSFYIIYIKTYFVVTVTSNAWWIIT